MVDINSLFSALVSDMGSQLGDRRDYLLGIYVNRCFMFSHIIALFLNINLNPIIGKYFSEDRVKTRIPSKDSIFWVYSVVISSHS